MSENQLRFIADPVFKTASEVARQLDMEAYVVGGYVRDSLLGRTSKDVDIVVIGDGIIYATLLAERLKAGNFNYFKNFGTANIQIKDWVIEIVGARKESYRQDSRKPLVSAGNLHDDQNRRDFTINALAISLNENDYGRLVDPFEGLMDLEKQILRTPLDPSITFSDDPLRMMRGIRFAAQLGFRLHPETYQGIKDNSERIKIVSAERISEELNKIILAKKPSIGFKLLFDTGLLALIFPEMYDLHGVESINGRSHKDNFYHTIEVLDNLSKTTDDLWLRWSAILHDIAKPATKRFDEKDGWTFHGHEDKGSRMVPGIFRNMKLPLNEKMKFVQKMVLLHLRPIALTKENITDSAIRRLIYEAGNDLEALMLLCKADITSKNDYKKKRYLENYILVEQKIKEVEENDRIRNWQPPVSGEMIMATFNLNPCKEVGIIKAAIREAILDGIIANNFDEAHSLMLEEGRKLGLIPVN